MYIAEIGINHKGSEEVANKMLCSVLNTKIDAVTFQVLSNEFYKNNKDYGDQLTPEFYIQAIKHTHNKDKLIGFSIDSLDCIPLLFDSCADFFKTLSYAFTNKNLMKELNKTKLPIFVSTGGISRREIKTTKLPELSILIQTEVSPHIKDVNLRAIRVLGSETAFGLHCNDTGVLFLSVCFNPIHTFFYVKDDTYTTYPDDAHAIQIKDINTTIDKMEYYKQAVGDGIKRRKKL